jgi:hypothetical protein
VRQGRLRRRSVVVVEDSEVLVVQALVRRLARRRGLAQVEVAHHGQALARLADQVDRREAQAWECQVLLAQQGRSDVGCRRRPGLLGRPTRSHTASGCGAWRDGAA